MSDDPLNEADERLIAIAEMLRCVRRDEGATSYTLDLAEMYVITDGVASMKQKCLNHDAVLVVADELKACRAERDRLAAIVERLPKTAATETRTRPSKRIV